MKVFKYVLVYLLLIQLALPYMLPFDLIFQHRMDYNLVKDNLEDIDVILDQISMQIQREKLDDYIIILGDSIAYSGPGNSSQSLGVVLQQLARQSMPGRPPRVYNLALPAMQTGDIYTMLLKLDQHHISTANLILNITYSGFVKRQPGPPAVFWLKDDLKRLDRDSFNRVLANLEANQYKDRLSLEAVLHQAVWDTVELYRYSPFIKKGLNLAYHDIRGARPPDDAIGDARPWFEKEGLRQILEQPEYKQAFASETFDMSSQNPQIYFLDKIISHQKNQHTLIFLAAANPSLMREELSAPGYIDNLRRIDQYFQNKPVGYLNTQGDIKADLFSDHLHLTAAGYRQLAIMLWDNFTKGARP